MMPGIGGIMAGIAGGFGMSFVDSAQSNAATCAIPATAAVGDVAVIIDFAHRVTDATIPTAVTPTGFTNSLSVGATVTSGTQAMRMMVSRKVLVGGDPGASITGMDSERDAKIILVFRPTMVLATVTANDVTNEITDGNPASQTCNANSGAAPVIVIGAMGTTGAPAFSTASPAFDAEILNDAGAVDLRVGYKIYNASPLDHTIDADDLGNGNCLGSFYYTLVAA